MLVLGVVVAVIVVVAGSAWALKRRTSGDAHSVEGYRQTLHTLQSLGARPTTGSRLRRDDDGAESRPLRPPRPGPPGRGSRPVFDDARPTEPPPVWGRRRPPAWTAPNRGRAVLLVGAAVVVVGVAAAVVLTGRHGPSSTTGRHTGGTGTTSAKSTTTTTTTVPQQYTPVSATATTATYAAPAASYALTLAATSGSCWVQVTDGSGKTIFAADVTPGASQTVTASGTTTVDLGAPTVVQVSLDHAPVVLPTGYRGPFTMTFAPPGTSTGSGGSGSSSATGGSFGTSAASSTTSSSSTG